MKDKVKFDVPEDETNNLPVDDTEEVVSDEEVTDDELETPEDAVEDDVESPFYAEGVYNELRDVMQDTDFRLFLINNDIVIPGTLNDDNEIQFLDIVGADDDEEFVLKDAPDTLEDLLEFKTLYNISNSEVEIPENIEVVEAPHEKIVEYILNLKVVDDDTEDIEDDESEIEAKEKEEEEDENESDE